MKKIFILMLFLILNSCSDTSVDNNDILPDKAVNVTLNLNLPLYQDLLFNNGSVFIDNHGIKGIIVFRFTENNIVAWEAACPHITPNQCSKMTINGVKMVCGCDNSEFSILDGSPLSGTPYAARQYRVIKNGNSITITNF